MSEWDEYADGWEEDPMVRAYAGAAFESLMSLLDRNGIALSGLSVIDFGCGTGLLAERLVAGGAAGVLAIDSSPAMLDVVRAKVERHGWTNVEAAPSLDAADGPVDLIVCSSVCAFLDDYPATVIDLTSRLAGGGFFVQWDWERTADDDHGLSRDQIRHALTAAGLQAVEVGIGFEVTAEGHSMAPLMGTGRQSVDNPPV